MPRVISASRRTDIPAFYSDWFVNRLEEGFVSVRQPYSGKFFSVSLNPAEVSAIVFWSKNYAPLLGKLPRLEQVTKNLFFHFTITGNRELEGSVPDYRDLLQDCRFIAKRYSPDQVVWRFDPICITDKLSYEMHEERFCVCLSLLRGYVKHCIVSFVHPYRRTLVNMEKYAGHRLLELSPEVQKNCANRLAGLAEAQGIRVAACCNDSLLSDSIEKASCINGPFLSSLFSVPIDTTAAATRKECACTKSVDIGAYDTCAHGCLYCYANADRERAREAFLLHDPSGAALGAQAVERDGGPAEQKQLPFDGSL